MLGQRLQRCPNINTVLGECFIISGTGRTCSFRAVKGRKSCPVNTIRWYNVGSALQTIGQQWANIGWMSRVFAWNQVVQCSAWHAWLGWSLVCTRTLLCKAKRGSICSLLKWTDTAFLALHGRADIAQRTRYVHLMLNQHRRRWANSKSKSYTAYKSRVCYKGTKSSSTKNIHCFIDKLER